MLHLTPEEKAGFDQIDFREAPDLSCRRLREVVVLRSGICLKHGLIVGSSVHRIPHLYPIHAAVAYGSRLRRRVVEADPERTYISVHNIWSGGYFHWLTESLARLRPVMNLLPQSTVLLPSNTGIGAVMQSSLACFGARHVEFFPPDANMRVGDLILPDNPRSLRDLSRGNLDFVRGHVLRDTGAGLPGSAGPARIYISRERAPGRRVLNEAEVVELLEAWGYVRIFPEELDFAEQVRLMHGAESVVAMHGAGLANILFMRPGATVLELHRRVPGGQNWRLGGLSTKLNASYPRLASHIGVHYHCLLCPAADLRQPFKTGDVIVDLRALEAKLRAIETAVA